MFSGLPAKRHIALDRSWTLNELKAYIESLYPKVPLQKSGYRFARKTKDWKLAFATDCNTVKELESFIGQNKMIIVPYGSFFRVEESDGKVSLLHSQLNLR